MKIRLHIHSPMIPLRWHEDCDRPEVVDETGAKAVGAKLVADWNEIERERYGEWARLYTLERVEINAGDGKGHHRID